MCFLMHWNLENLR